MKKISCFGCGIKFEARSHAKTCSTKCRMRVHRAAKNIEDMAEKAKNEVKHLESAVSNLSRNLAADQGGYISANNPAPATPAGSVLESQQNYPLEDLEVHNQAAPNQPWAVTPAVAGPVKKSGLLSFSKRKAAFISIAMTALITVTTGIGMLFFASNNAQKKQDSSISVETQDVELEGTKVSELPPGLDEAGEALIVNGSIITSGELKFSNDDFTTTLTIQDPTSDQTVSLPNASGIVCLDSNNCNYASAGGLNGLQTQTAAFNNRINILSNQLNDLSNQLESSEGPPVTRINGQTGDVTLQGTANQINVSSSSGVVTFSTPQDIATSSAPSFAGLTLTSALGVTSGGTGLNAVTTGDILYGSGVDTLGRIAVGSNGQCFTIAGGLPTWGSCAGSGVTLQGAYDNGNTITTAAFAGGRDISITLADTATDSNFIVNIAASSTSRFAIQDNGSDILSVDSNGVVINSGGLVIGGGDVTISGDLDLSAGTLQTNGTVRLTNGGILQNVTYAGSTIGVGFGGTGAISFTSNGVLYGNGAGAIQASAAGTSGQLLVANGSGVPTFVTLGSDATLAANGSLTISADAVALGTDTTGNYVSTITAGNGISGAASSEGATPTIALSNLTADWVQNGAFDIVLNNGSSELKILESAGGTFLGTLDVGDLSADRTYTLPDVGGQISILGQTIDLTSEVTGTLPATNGGTGQNTVVMGDILYGSAADTWSRLPVGTDGECLVSNAGTLDWGACAVTLQNAYTFGNTIDTTNNRNIAFTLSDNTTDSDFIVNMLGTGNTVEFRDGGTSYATFSDGGQVLFKPTTNSTTAFQIQPSASTTPVLSVDTSNSRLGLGTASPGYKLDLRSSSSASQLHFASADLDSGGYLTSAGADNFFASAGTSWNGSAWVAKSTVAGVIGSLAGQLQFYTNSGLTVGNTFTPTQRMVVLSSGNVGIGDATPASLFTVGDNDLFQVNASGAIARVAGITINAATDITTSTDQDLTLDANGTGKLVVADATVTLSGGNTSLDITGAATRTLSLLNSTSSQVANFDLSDGSLLTGGTTRLDNTGNLLNILNITSTGAVSFTPSGTNHITLTSDSDSFVKLPGLGTVSGDNLCIDASDNLVKCAASGSVTLQVAYEGGNTITTDDTAGSIIFTLDDTASDQDFIVDMLGTGNTAEFRDGGTAFFSLKNNAGGSTTSVLVQPTVDSTQYLKIRNAADTLTVFNVDTTNGRIGIGNNAPSTELHVTGNARITGLVSCDTIDTDANGALVCGSDAGAGGGGAPNGASYITATTDGSLTAERVLTAGTNIDITDGGANSTMTVATVNNPTFSTSVTTPTVAGSTTLSLTSTGAGNDIILNSADTIELQDNTNVTGNLDVSGTFTSGTADAFQVNSSGELIAGSITSGFGSIDVGSDAINGGSIQTSSTTRITSTGILQNVTYNGNVIDVDYGGTGAATLTSNGVLYGNGTGAIQATAAGTSGQLLVANGSGVPTFVSLGSDATLAANGDLTISADAVALTTDTTGNYVAEIAAGSGISGSASSEGATPTIALGDLTADWTQSGAFDIVLNNASSEISILESAGDSFFGKIDVTDLSADRTYTLPDADGEVSLLGQTIALNSSEVTGTLAATNGGTGQNTVTTGDLLYGSGTDTWSKRAIGTAGQCLIVSGGLPAWGSCGGTGSGVTLQSAYNNGNTILTTNARDVAITLANEATDPNFLIDIATGSTSRFAVQNNGTDVLAVASSGTTFSAVATFSGLSTDITTATDEDLTFLANGNGQIILNDLTQIPTLGSATTPVALCRNASNQLSTCGTNSAGVTLQHAYDAGNTITTTDSRDVLITADETTTDSSVVVNLNCATCSAGGGVFKVQNTSTDVFTISNNSSSSAAFLFKPKTNSTVALQVQPTASSIPVINVDTANSRFGVNLDNPQDALHVIGQVRVDNDNSVAGAACLRYTGTELQFSNDCSSYQGFGSATGGWADDGANVRLTTASDTVTIGTSTPGSLGEKLYVTRNNSTSSQVIVMTITGAQTVASASSFNTLQAIPHYNATGTLNSLTSAYLSTRHNSSGTVTNNYAVILGPQNNSTGTVTNMYGAAVQLTNENASGTVTNGYGIRILTPNNSGTITNNYGLYLEDQAIGNAGYAIYSAGGRNFFNYGGFTQNALQIDAVSLTSGIGFDLNNTSIQSTSADTMQVSHVATFAATNTVSGQIAEFSRTLVASGATTTLTISGPAVSISSSCATASSGTCSRTSGGDVLRVTEDDTSVDGSATSAVLRVDNGGTGFGLWVGDDGSTTDSTPFVVDSIGRVGIGNSNLSNDKLNVTANLSELGDGGRALALHTNFNSATVTSGGLNVAGSISAAPTYISMISTSSNLITTTSTLPNLTGIRTGGGSVNNDTFRCNNNLTCTATNVHGFLGSQSVRANTGSTFNVTSLYGMQIAGENWHNEGTLNITNKFGLYISHDNHGAAGGGGGTMNITNNEAIRIDDNSLGNGTGYAIRSLGGIVRLQGSQPDAVGTATGTYAGNILDVVGGTGGNTNIVTSGTGGAGSNVALTGGTGGIAGLAANVSTGGAGGKLTLQGGTGGAATIAGITNTGGAGGDIEILGGAGGTASGGVSNTGGTGGDIYLYPGSATGSSAHGDVLLGVNSANNPRGNVGIGLNNPSDKLHVLGQVRIDNVSTGNAGCLRYSGTQLEFSHDCSTFQGIPISTSGGGWNDGGTLVNLTTNTDNVTIGSSSNLAKLAVDGDTDEIQLLVQGHSTQTSNLVVVENSSGGDLFVISGTGRVGINDTNPDADLDIGHSSGATGKAFEAISNILTTGILVNLQNNSTASTSADLIRGGHTATYTAATTVSGNLLDLSRSLTVNDGDALFTSTTLTVNSPIATFSDNCTVVGNDVCTHTGDTFKIIQNYASSSGTTLRVTNAGTGNSFRVNDDGSETDNTPFVITNNGKVGIQQAAPDLDLHIGGSWGGFINSGNPNRGIVIASETDGDEVGIILSVNDTSPQEDRRFKLFLDDTDAIWGFDATSATATVGNFVIQRDGSTAFMIGMNSDNIGSAGLGNVSTVLSSSNLPDGSFVVANGAFCVDNGGDNCDDSSRTAGTIYANNTTVQGMDLAENYPTKDETLGASELVIMTPEGDTPYVSRSSGIGSRNSLLGVVSAEPGVTLGGFGSEDLQAYRKVPVALAGRVPVKVNTENGPIMPGDYITTSSVPGVGMKATSAGVVIGVAISSYSGEGTGEVLVFINPMWYTPTATELVQGTSGQFGNLNVSGLATIKDLKVTGTLKVAELHVEGHILGNEDTSGEVTIVAGTDKIEFTFKKPFETAPYVVVSPTNSFTTYRVESTENGFTIYLAEPAGLDTKFNYHVQGRGTQTSQAP